MVMAVRANREMCSGAATPAVGKVRDLGVEQLLMLSEPTHAAVSHSEKRYSAFDIR
jgi:hypothetical protein